MNPSEATIAVSIVSHTNVGKTTLARTLLRSDVGEVFDQAHVTIENERFPLLETERGDRLVLWDTPGFGDSRRLLRRLETEGQPLRWLLTQTWDRVANLPLWSSQQAVRNIRDEADAVFYVVNAAEDPAHAGYVEPELRILEWIDKPVLVLLNQTGRERDPEARLHDEKRWRDHVGRSPVVRDVLSLDAFTRCWIEEGRLLEMLAGVLADDRKDAMQRLLAEWERRNLETFRESMELVAALLAEASTDGEAPSGGVLPGSAARNAAANLAGRLRRRVGDTTTRLVRLHGLEGDGAGELETRLEDVSAPGDRPDPLQTGLWGSLLGGLAGGLWGDLTMGGLSLGGGAIAGALLGALGGAGLGWAFQTFEDGTEPRVTWSTDFLDRQVRDALLRYLSVAHYGRGAGEYRLREHPEYWRSAVERAVRGNERELHAIWEEARRKGSGETKDVTERLTRILGACTLELLREAYPESRRFLK